ncbi:DNA-directed DNA polymerase [Melia azedarach]|uniref:DNA-directed DNA polymerase n=1 Tax=Melia azedarach TaxID=155640 RepID=A0ACC1XUS5_MELAZ|nr:DNA-directed DNA polymerase [Melia azedarach]
MRKAGSSVLLPFDIEIERTCRRNRKEKSEASTQPQTYTMEPNVGNNVGPEDQRALRDYAVPTVNGASTSIRRPAIQTNNFEIKPAIIQMIQTSIQFNGLGSATRTLIDTAAGDALMEKTTDEAYDLLKEMAANAYQWPTKRLTSKKVLGVHEVDSISVLTAQLTTLTKQLEAMIANSIHIPQMVCELCSGNHSSTDCQVGNPFAVSSFEQVSYVGNYNQQNNLYSNTYNQGWQNHSNFSWKGNQTAARSTPKFQPQEKNVSLEEALAQLTMNTSKFMTNTETTLENQAASIQNLEVQVGRMV